MATKKAKTKARSRTAVRRATPPAKKAPAKKRSRKKLPVYPADPDDDATVSSQFLCKLFNLSLRRVTDLAQRDIVVRDVPGRYRLIDSVLGYVTYLQQIERTGATRLQEDARLKTAQASLRELELKRARGEVVSVAVVDTVATELTVLFLNELKALPARLAADCAGRPAAEIKARADDEQRRIRSGVERGLARLATVVPEAGRIGKATTKANAGSVGRRRKGVATGKRGARTVSK